jgi:RNA polymerase sigma-70 factor (ECF subfamily)
MLCKNSEDAKEITQDALLEGFRHFDALNDKQKAFAWLKTIAKRIYLRKYCRGDPYGIISLDAPLYDGDDFVFADTVANENIDIEKDYQRGELFEKILNETRSLSEKQKNSVMLRYFYGYSIKETSEMLKMSESSVKVSSHIGLEKVKERLKNYFIEGDYIMDCIKAYAYLHQYAKKQISAREKEELEKHINVCKECRDIAHSLEQLEKHITPAQEKEHRNYVLHLQLDEYCLEYVTVFMDVERYREINEKIEEWGGEVPIESINLKYQGFLASGFKFVLSDYTGAELLALFGDDGFNWPFEEYERDDYAITYRIAKINKLKNPNEFSIVFLKKERKLKQSAEHPDLIHGYAKNWARRENGGKLGVYLGVPSSGTNLRITQGEGVIDCGAYKFVYADRHAAGNECVSVCCSFIK